MATAKWKTPSGNPHQHDTHRNNTTAESHATTPMFLKFLKEKIQKQHNYGYIYDTHKIFKYSLIFLFYIQLNYRGN